MILCGPIIPVSRLQEWFTVLEHYHRLSATVSDLIMGNSYSFRVFTENQVGMSEKGAVTKDVANIQKTGGLPPNLQDLWFNPLETHSVSEPQHKLVLQV